VVFISSVFLSLSLFKQQTSSVEKMHNIASVSRRVLYGVRVRCRSNPDGDLAVLALVVCIQRLHWNEYLR